MRKLLLTLSLLAGSLLFITSCTKTGPVGPQGPQGFQGNANVVGSDPFNVTAWQFSNTENAFYASFNYSGLTSDVAARGVFQVFLYYSGDGTWKALPDIYNGTQFYDRFSTGGFEIYYGNVDGTTPSPLSGTWTFRTVVIAPSQKQAHPNTNWRNYDEIMKVANESKAVVSTTTVSQ
jgi:hypothetical protein